MTKDEKFELLKDFVEERIGVWEAKHGLLSDEGRACMNVLLFGCLNVDSDRVLEYIDLKNSDESYEDCARHCYCERDCGS